MAHTALLPGAIRYFQTMTSSGTRDQPRPHAPTSAIQARTESILAALAEGVVIIDAEGVVVAVNESGERILGAPHGAMLGRVLVELPWSAYEEDGRELDLAAHPIVAALRSGQSQPERLLLYPRYDGASLWIRLLLYPRRLPDCLVPQIP